MNKRNLAVIVFLFLALAAASARRAEKNPPVKNVIYLIGDGMGL